MRNLTKILFTNMIFLLVLCLLVSGCSFRNEQRKSNYQNKSASVTIRTREKNKNTSQKTNAVQQVEKFIEINKKQIDETDKNGNIIKVEYPYITKCSYSFQTVVKVNKAIENFVNKELQEAKTLGNFGVLGISYAYHFIKPKDIFSVLFFIDGGGSGGYYESAAFNFDLKNGELICREDIIDSSALKKIRSYITFLSATCCDLELKTPKYKESLFKATENTDIQIDNKMLLKDDGIEIYFPSFDIDPNGKNYAKFFIKYDELQKNKVEKVVINSSNDLESILKMNLKDIRTKFGLCDIVYIWDGGVHYNIGSIEWTYNVDEGSYAEADVKTPMAVVFREGSTLFGVEIMKTDPDQAYEILKNNKSGEIKDVTKGEGPDSEEIVTCELNNGITIYFEAGRESIDSNELKVVNAIVKWSDISN